MQWINKKEQPLLEALKEGFPDSSNTTLRSWIESQRVYIEDKLVVYGKCDVRAGQKISLAKRKTYMRSGIEILYEDDQLVVLYKPSGILSVATEYDQMNNVHSYLKKRFHQRKVFPVHRLDREASGVMVFAYTEQAKDHLKKQFEEHSISRQYLAIVEGDLQPSKGTWQSYLYEDSSYYVKSVDDPTLGKLSTTHYQVIKRKYNASTLLVSLETGRKNQIRAHCKEAGHPIIGDKKYKSTIELGDRVALHAYKLGFEHPTLKKPMTFEQAAPPELSRYLPASFSLIKPPKKRVFKKRKSSK